MRGGEGCPAFSADSQLQKPLTGSLADCRVKRRQALLGYVADAHLFVAAVGKKGRRGHCMSTSEQWSSIRRNRHAMDKAFGRLRPSGDGPQNLGRNGGDDARSDAGMRSSRESGQAARQVLAMLVMLVLGLCVSCLCFVGRGGGGEKK